MTGPGHDRFYVVDGTPRQPPDVPPNFSWKSCDLVSAEPDSSVYVPRSWHVTALSVLNLSTVFGDTYNE
jgi:hypothetical protein